MICLKSIIDVTLELEDNVQKLNANDTKLQESMHQEIVSVHQAIQTEIDEINSNVDVIKEMPVGNAILRYPNSQLLFYLS